MGELLQFKYLLIYYINYNNILYICVTFLDFFWKDIKNLILR